jgi:hypothetical protein
MSNEGTENLYVMSVFHAPVKNTVNNIPTHVREIHTRIKSDLYDAKTKYHRSLTPDEQKKNKLTAFDYFCPNATFKDRSDEGVIQLSGAFVADLDNQENIGEIKSALAADKILNPILIFESPGGNGIKFIVPIDTSLINLQLESKIMEIYWTSVNNYLKKIYSHLITPGKNGNYIDPSGKDLSRACFLCTDRTAYLNENPDSVLGQSFIQEYPNEVKGRSKPMQSPRVSVKTTLSGLATRHLTKTDNHTNELVAFICAAMKIGCDRASVLQYITENVHIAAGSSKANHATLELCIYDLFERYGSANSNIIQLTPLQFAKGILSFKHSREANGFILAGLYYEGVRQYLHSLGFAKRYTSKTTPVYIKISGCVITEVSVEQMRDKVTQYVETFSSDLSFQHQGINYQIPYEAIRETFLKNSNNIFNEVWMEHLQTHDIPLLKDSRTHTHLFFRNGLVSISAEGIQSRSWTEVTEFCVWENQLIGHDFEYVADNQKSEFGKFLLNVNAQDPARFSAMRSAVGYLMNYDFKPSGGQAVIFYDEEITDTKSPQGGSGKGLIMNGLKQVKHVQKIDGKHLDPTNQFKFEEVTPGTQVIWLDDVKHDFDFSILYSNLTDGWTIERKHKPKHQIAVADSPKVAICSNAIIKGSGSSTIRRQFVYELSNHYSKKIIFGNESPIETEHGGLFFSSDWTTTEWNRFFSFMIDCAQDYLAKGIIIHKVINVEINRLKQSTNEDFVIWCEGKVFGMNKRYYTKELYLEFVSVYYGAGSNFHQRTFTNWLKAYATFLGCDMEIGQTHSQPYFLFIPKNESVRKEVTANPF